MEQAQDNLLTLVVALVGIIALSGMYVQIMHKIYDNIRQAEKSKRMESVKKGKWIMRLLAVQVFLFFIVIAALIVAISPAMGKMGCLGYVIGIPFVISQVVHFVVFSYSCYLWLWK
jgi:ABC-type sulfate transport system permease subunit